VQEIRYRTIPHGWAFRSYKTEVIGRRGPWRDLEAVEFATLEWVD
jgi:hypothetical protein